MAIEREDAKVWGGWLRRNREILGLSQDRFADQIVLICAHMSNVEAERFRHLRIECPEALAGYEISRFEGGQRLPMRRSTHMLLIWTLLKLGVALDANEINRWLELGLQGWLTNRERELLFG